MSLKNPGRAGRCVLAAFFCLLLNACVSNSYTLYFTRHAEKMPTRDRNPALNAQGRQRAEALAVYLNKETPGKKIRYIYSTNYHRTQSTAAPSAQVLAIPINDYDPGKLPAFAKMLLQQKQSALIVGHTNTTPALVKLVGGQASALEESQYGDLFEVTIKNGEVSTTRHLIEIPGK